VGAAATSTELLDRVRAGHVPSIARLISLVESRVEDVVDLLPALYAAGGNAHIVGVTGAPGSGKSTLVGALIRELRARGRTVAVVAIDPSSPFTGGAILGDRIRMQEHALDPGVFMRSMSSRGALGGLSRAAVEAISVFDAAGWDVVIVETVGAGQAEIDVVRTAHTTVVVSVPGMGDDVQAIKAGVLEIADLHVVNKADRPGTNKTVLELRGMLHFGAHPEEGDWRTPVLETIGADGTGVPELADAIDAHRSWLRASGELPRRERLAAAERVTTLVKDLMIEQLAQPAGGDAFARAIDDVSMRRVDPRTAARGLIQELVT
jgi:LAO/AO transport system kinase